MHKAIEYAYATSDTAKRLGRARQGCYFIEVKAHYSDVKRKRIEGPFDTIEDAEEAASFIQADWSPYTKRAARIGIDKDSQGREFLTLNGKAARSKACSCQIHVETVDGADSVMLAVDAFNAALSKARAALA